MFSTGWVMIPIQFWNGSPKSMPPRQHCSRISLPEGELKWCPVEEKKLPSPQMVQRSFLTWHSQLARGQNEAGASRRNTLATPNWQENRLLFKLTKRSILIGESRRQVICHRIVLPFVGRVRSRHLSGVCILL